MTKININKKCLDDSSYRYQMYPVIVKHSGNKNGFRTAITNLDKICIDIRREPELVMIYLSLSMGCKYIFLNEQWILYGDFTEGQIQDNIFNFISMFVLCKGCQNPETNIVHSSIGRTGLQCDACSCVSEIPLNKNTEKILRHIKK